MSLDVSDRELIERYRSGEERALAFLFQRYVSSIYRFIYRMVGDRAVAEDLVQETFVKAWKKLSSFDASRSFKAWLFTIAKNSALDELRKKHPIAFSLWKNEEDDEPFSDSLVDDQPLMDEVLQIQEDHQLLSKALDELSPPIKSLVLMRAEEDLTFQEIADVHRESLNTVKSRYRRAIIALQKAMHRLKTPDKPPSAPKP